jgi:hypothetical protein
VGFFLSASRRTLRRRDLRGIWDQVPVRSRCCPPVKVLQQTLPDAVSFSVADAYPTSISSVVSTSNHLPREDITIETDVPIVWTMEVRESNR